MSVRSGLVPCIVFALPAASNDPDGAGLVPAQDHEAAGSSEPARPALAAWADFDGDGRLDLTAVSADGRLQLLANAGRGNFEDATERLGLAGVTNAALALWGDYDGDQRLDLFVGARAGASRLFHAEDGGFVDMSAGSGLVVAGAVRSAQWLDYDGDERPDLFVATAERNELFRGLEGGFFSAAELPAFATPIFGGASGGLPARPIEARSGGGAAGSGSAGSARGSPPVARGPRTGVPTAIDGRVSPAPSSALTVDPPTLLAFPLACASSIKDKASPGSCLEASTTPALGRLFPLSTSLFVAVGGNVGVGTTSPAARLHVAGTARVTDTLTLAPPGDTALDVSSGSIYKGGALFLHTRGGTNNTAVGREALKSVTSGYSNTASGFHALFANTTGYANTALGDSALAASTSGYLNTATGYHALAANTADGNTAHGANALRANTSGGSNTAVGISALAANTTGASNTATGSGALLSNTTASSNTANGASALYANTTGFNNTGVGAEALRFNTMGTRNTAVGFRALFMNSSSIWNTAVGEQALYASTGGYNTALGRAALRSNSGGVRNTAAGAMALYANVNGQLNVALGMNALRKTTSGSRNTGSGYQALYANTTGIGNVAVGFKALTTNTTGGYNTALGSYAGAALTGSSNIAIGNTGIAGESNTVRLGTGGTHTRVFVAGIRGVTTGVANAIPVLIDSAGQLGTVSSSARFKEEIRDMGELTDRLLALRPVVFRYKPEVQAGERPLEYGLIAEEVAEVFPELVVYGDDGQPFTVKYHLLSAMLLNELEKLHERVEERDAAHERELGDLRARVLALEGLAAPDAASTLAR